MRYGALTYLIPWLRWVDATCNELVMFVRAKSCSLPKAPRVMSVVGATFQLVRDPAFTSDDHIRRSCRRIALVSYLSVEALHSLSIEYPAEVTS